ncbi:MAG: DUF4236 domain-containing protein [Desulfovibrio sp.]|nr:DUF4236 domain-containing protein [Desulfovibrio sp.]
MGFRFKKSIKLLPGVKLNVGKRGTSLTVGKRGASVTFGKKGARTNVGIPGTGLSYGGKPGCAALLLIVTGLTCAVFLYNS